MLKQALLFGVFDGLHDGHKHMLKQALGLADQLIVVVARPEQVEKIKGHLPKFTLGERIDKLKEFDQRIEAIAGDWEQGQWTALQTYKPGVVLLGYDQQAIAAELNKLGQRYQFLQPFRPEQFKSSKLNH